MKGTIILAFSQTLPLKLPWGIPGVKEEVCSSSFEERFLVCSQIFHHATTWQGTGSILCLNILITDRAESLWLSL